ncbi:MAG: hypothetical protein WD691_02110 [Acidimicrobiales bacterium]
MLSVPLLVALAGFRRDPWTPVLDLAMTELRVRDVGGSHTPLVGLPGRIGSLAQQGSHPGPLSFYALAPTYRLLGSTAWALQAATVLVHVVAMGVALVIARRRGGRALILAVAVLLAVLLAGYGGGVLTEPWNPYLPLLWWVVVLLGVWSVLDGDLAMLPVVAVAGSFCGQTHVPYLGLCIGIAALTAGSLARRWIRTPGDRGRIRRWSIMTLALGVLLWTPPTIDQARHDPGNYRQLVDHFAHPPEAARGLGVGVQDGLEHFDVAYLAWADLQDPGALVRPPSGMQPSAARGAVLLVLWVMAAAASWRRRDRVLMALHAVVGASAFLMVLAISRIFGRVWYYLTLWGWVIGAVAALAVVWSVASLVGDHVRDRWPGVARGAPVVLAVLAVALTTRFTASAWDSQHADAPVAADLAAVVDETAAGLDANEGAATGRQGRYLVSWADAFHIGSQGYGLLNELERRGFDVGVDHSARVPATAHRVLDRSHATARIELATGVNVERWRAVPGAVEIVTFDPRSAKGREEQAQLRGEVIATLRRLGLNDLVTEVDDNLFGVAIDERVPVATQQQMGRMLEIGAPLSIFVAPVDTPDL